MGNPPSSADPQGGTPDEVIEGEPVDDAEAEETEAPVTAQTIVSEWLDRCAERPPSRVIGQLSREIRVLLDEDRIAPDWIRRGIARWMQKNLHPATLASVVHEVMNTTDPAGTARGQQSDGGTVFDRARARAAARAAQRQEGQP
ncbi:hypothetical protein ACWF94_34685 [Streptomyces sp. NPDC055078]